MKRLNLCLLAITASLWGTQAFAAAQCVGPQQDGNTWNLICSADGSGDDDYQCDYFISLTNEQGLTYTAEASGSVGQGQSGVVIWSGIQSEGGNIVAANIVRGSCSQ